MVEQNRKDIVECPHCHLKSTPRDEQELKRLQNRFLPVYIRCVPTIARAGLYI